MKNKILILLLIIAVLTVFLIFTAIANYNNCKKIQELNNSIIGLNLQIDTQAIIIKDLHNKVTASNQYIEHITIELLGLQEYLEQLKSEKISIEAYAIMAEYILVNNLGIEFRKTN